MNKKITGSVLTALIIAGTTSFSAFAAMASGTVVIGNKAFDINYVNDPANITEITSAIVAGGEVYVKDFAGNWVDNITGLKVAASAIPAVTYKSVTGVETKLNAKDTDVSTETSVEAVSAVTAKSLKVTFSGAVDTTKAVVGVTKGSVKVNTETITWNTDKTEATIALTGKLTVGDYSVNVTGLSTVALTKTITVASETVDSVEILNENGILNAAGTAVTVGYKVLNQYGEDLSSTTQLTVNAAGTVVNGAATYSKGVVTIPVAGTVKEGDSIVLTLVNAETGKSATKIVKVSSKAQVADLTISSLYNKDGKVLTETTDLTKDVFYLIVEGKDQYGNVVKEAALDTANAIIVNQTNKLVADVSTNFETITINGVDVTALRVTGTPSVGLTTVMAISTSTGRNASYALNVVESQRSDTVSFEVPELVVANEDLFVPVQVSDKQGNAITDLKVLSNAARGVKISGVAGVATITEKAGVLGIAVPKASVNEGYLSLVAVTSTGKSAITNVQVRAEAKPVRVDGVDSTVGTTILSNSAAQVLTSANVTIIDQYERVMTAAQKIASFATGAPKYTLVTTEEKTGAGILEGAIDLVNNSVSPMAIGAEKVTISIQKTGDVNPLSASEKSVSFRVTDGTEYVSYKVNPIGNMFDEVGAGLANTAAYNGAVAVYGILNDGTEVAITSDKFTVDAPAFLDYANGVISLDTTDPKVPYATDAKSYTANVKVTINATGAKFAQDVIVSKVNPTITAVKIVAEATVAADVDTKAKFDKIIEVAKSTSGLAVTNVSNLVDFAVVDSYGVITLNESGAATTYLPEVKLTAVPSKAFEIKIVDNNASTLTLGDLNLGEFATVTLSVSGLTKTFVVDGTYDLAAAKAAATQVVATAQANLDALVNPTAVNLATATTNVGLKPTAVNLATATTNVGLKPTAENLATATTNVGLKPTAVNLAAAKTTLGTSADDAAALAVVAADAAAVTGQLVIDAQTAAVAGQLVVDAQTAAVAGQLVVDASTAYTAAATVLANAKIALAAL